MSIVPARGLESIPRGRAHRRAAIDEHRAHAGLTSEPLDDSQQERAVARAELDKKARGRRLPRAGRASPCPCVP